MLKELPLAGLLLGELLPGEVLGETTALGGSGFLESVTGVELLQLTNPRIKTAINWIFVTCVKHMARFRLRIGREYLVR